MPGSNEHNLYMRFIERARTAPEGTLIAVDNEPIQNSAFIDATDRIATALIETGAQPGDRVGLILPNGVSWYTIFWAAVRTGLIPVPLDPQIGAWEIERLIALAEIKICFVATCYRENPLLEHLLAVGPSAPLLRHVVVVDETTTRLPKHGETTSLDILRYESFLDAASATRPSCPVAEVDDAAPLMLACTSGSTGAPKIIVVPHIGFYQSQRDMAEYLGLGPDDVMLLGMPLYHQGGFGMGLQMVLGGGTVFYQSTFEPAEFLSMIERHRVTVLQLSPTVAKIILSVPRFEDADLSSLRLVYFAGEVLPWEVARVFIETIGARVVNIVGSTETATMVVWDSDYCDDQEVNTYRPLPFTELKILDDARESVPVGETGTIHIHTDALLSEYLGNEEETKRRLYRMDHKRWFDTGDLGLRCADGRVTFSGRAKRVVKRGGNLIYPEEVECFLLTHPDIEAVAVTSERHELIGERLVAHIQPRNGVRFTRLDMIRYCSGQLATYKIPDRTIVVDDLPKDIGKVQFRYMKNKQDASHGADEADE